MASASATLTTPCARRLKLSNTKPATAHVAHCQPADRSSAIIASFFAVLIDAVRASSIRAEVADSASAVSKRAQARRDVT